MDDPDHLIEAAAVEPGELGAGRPPGVAIRLPPPPPDPIQPDLGHRMFRLMAAMMVGGSVGWLGNKWMAAHAAMLRGHGDRQAIVLLSLPVLWLLVVAWHELGHLVAGRLVGGQFFLLLVGPLKWQRTPQGIRFSWNQRLNLFGGLASSAPVDGHRLAERFAVMVAGGPIFSAILAGLGLMASRWLSSAGWPLAAGLAGFAAAISAVLVVLAIIPMEGNGLRTDGYQLLRFLGRGAHSSRDAALLSLRHQGLAGIRPANYPAASLAAALTPEDGSLDAVFGHLFAYYHYADRDEPVLAQEHLDRLFAGEARLGPVQRDTFRLEYAWLLAAYASGGAAAARAWWNSAKKAGVSPAIRLRAEAAILLAEGNVAEATAKARDGLAALDEASMGLVRSEFGVQAFEAILRRAGAA